MEIVLLGTSAALPTLSRWPSALAIKRAGELLLFDCGEGAQIRFQQEKLKPGKLSKIFISHFHGDHFYGLIGLLTSLQLGGRDKPMDIYAPRGMNQYLDAMKRLSSFDFGYPVRVFEFKAGAKEAIWDFGDYSVCAQPLDHSLLCLGFRLEEKPRPGTFDRELADTLGIPHGPERSALTAGQSITLANGKTVKPADVMGPPKPGGKIAICTDTRPCDAAIALAAEVDLLIHEATFVTAKQALAEQSGHSTAAQAAQIARTANAKKLVLTHISARYAGTDEKLLLAEAQAIFPNTEIGKDAMRLQVTVDAEPGGE